MSPPRGSVICVHVDPRHYLTAACQIAAMHNALVVACGKQVLPRHKLQTFYWKKASDAVTVPYTKVVTIGAHFLHSERDCNRLLSHIRKDFTVLHIVPEQYNLSGRLVPRAYTTVFLAPLNIKGASQAWNTPKTEIPNVPARQVDVKVVSTHEETQQEEADRPCPDDVTHEFCSAPDGALIVLFEGCAVRAVHSPKLEFAGVADGLFGIVECFQNHLPVVRFCNGVVQRVGLELTTKQRKEEKEPMLPLSPCTKIVEVRAIQEVGILPSGWRLCVEDNFNKFGIEHLLHI